MIRAVPLTACILALAFLTACGDEAQPYFPSPSASPLASESPSPGPVSAQRVLAEPGPKLVYIRNLDSDAVVAGQLWLATVDGSLTAPLTPADTDAVFAGFQRSNGNALIYYATLDGGTARTLWATDLSTGVTRSILSFKGRHDFDAYASLSPDGRRVAYTDSDSVFLFTLDDGERHLLLQGNGPACDGEQERAPNPVAGCFVYNQAIWSPNGTLLLVQKGFYEGSRPVIVDPFAARPVEIEAVTDQSVGPRAWSPDSDSFCGTNNYGGTGLYLASAPGWELTDLLPEYALPTDPPPRIERYIQSCDWLDADAIAFATGVAGYPEPITRSAPPLLSLEMSLHFPRTGETRSLAAFDVEGQLFSPQLLAIPDSGSVTLQYYGGPAGSPRSTPAQPQLIDVTTGALTPILAAGDWIVAVLPSPISDPAASACPAIARTEMSLSTGLFTPERPPSAGWTLMAPPHTKSPATSATGPTAKPGSRDSPP